MLNVTLQDLKDIIKESEIALKLKNLNYYTSWQNYKAKHLDLDILLKERLKLKGKENYEKFITRNYILFEQSLYEGYDDIIFNQLIDVISSNEHELKIYKK